jgi:hypothetical protein
MLKRTLTSQTATSTIVVSQTFHLVEVSPLRKVETYQAPMKVCICLKSKYDV